MSKKSGLAMHEQAEIMTAKAAGLLAQKEVLMETVEMAYHELRVRNGYKPGDACYDELARVIISFSEERPGWCHDPDEDTEVIKADEYSKTGDIFDDNKWK